MIYIFSTGAICSPKNTVHIMKLTLPLEAAVCDGCDCVPYNSKSSIVCQAVCMVMRKKEKKNLTTLHDPFHLQYRKPQKGDMESRAG